MERYWMGALVVLFVWLSGFIAGLFWCDCRTAIKNENKEKKGTNNA